MKHLLDFNKYEIESNRKITKSDNSIEEIAIIGISIKLPEADNFNEFWDNITNGKDSVREIPKNRKKDIDKYINYNYDKYKDSKISEIGYLDDISQFDYNFFGISAKEAELIDPNQRLLLQTAYHAIEDAGYAGKNIKGSKTGVYIGFGGALTYGNLIDEFEPSSKAASIPGNITPVIAGRISYTLDLKGPAVIIDTACSSSLVAVHTACNALKNRECNMAIAGSVNLHLLPLEGRIAIGIESSDGKTRAFDDSSDGSGLGEGVAAVLLKPLKNAILDSDHIYAVIKGSAVNQDGNSIGITAPNPKSQEDVLVQAWRNANIDPCTIDYIEAHGTGTKLGDPIEIEGITKAFQRYTGRKQFCALSTVKTNLGHLENASGIIGLIKAVLALQYKKIPPMIHFNKPNRNIDLHKSPIYIANECMAWKTDSKNRRCGVSSFGLSGTNCHVVLEEYKEAKSEKMVAGKKVYFFTLSAKKKEAVESLVKEYVEYFHQHPEEDIGDICYTLNVGREHFNCRLLIRAESADEVKNKLIEIAQKGLDYLQDDNIYYNQFRVVAANKKDREDGEIYEDEIKSLNKDASKLLMQLNTKIFSDGNALSRLCRLYTKGADVAWEMLYSNRTHRRVSLPSYPFDKTKSWVAVPNTYMAEKNKLLYCLTWKESALNDKTIKKKYNCILLFEDKRGIANTITKNLKEDMTDVITVEFGSSYLKVNNNHYIINGEKQDYIKLMLELKNKEIDGVIHLSSLKQGCEIDSLTALENNQHLGIYSIKYLTEVFSENNLTNIELIIISEYSNQVHGTEEYICPENATIFGFARALAVTTTDYNIRCIDIDNNTDVNHIMTEIKSIGREGVSVFRSNIRYTEVIEQLEPVLFTQDQTEIKENGVYVITGGTGRLGLVMCEYLSSKKHVKLQLINRTAFPDRKDWEAIVLTSGNNTIKEKIKVIQKVEESGSDINFISADITRIDDTDAALQAIRENYGRIDGVIHCAAVGVGEWEKDASEKTVYSFEDELQTKVHGTWILDQLTRKDDLDFMLLFSSVITIIGGEGVNAYTAANSYLDSFTYYRNRQGKKTLTVNWPTWRNTTKGIQNIEYFESRQIFEVIENREAVAVLDSVLSFNIERVIGGRLNFNSPVFELMEYLPFRLSDKLLGFYHNLVGKKDEKQIHTITEVVLTGRTSGPYTRIEKTVAQIWSEQLKLKKLDIYDNFYDLGGNSIIAVRIINNINNIYKIKTDISDLMKFSNFYEFTKYLEKICENNTTDADTESVPKPVIEKEFYTVSAAQKRMLILNEFEKDSTSYNNTTVMKITGQLDVDRFKEAFLQLGARHEALRTSFELRGEEWVQKIQKKTEIGIECMKCKSDEFMDLLKKFIRPFDLSKTPLIRVLLAEIDEYTHYFAYDLHHIISDGITINIILKELAELYSGRTLPPLKLQYKDFSEWQNKQLESGALKVQEEYWVTKFKDEIPALQLPLDVKRPNIRNLRGASVKVKIENEMFRNLSSYAVSRDSTIYMVLLSFFNVLLFKYTGQQDIIVGTPISGRVQYDLESVVGMFINTIAMRNFPKGDKSFDEFFNEVKMNSLKAYQNQDYPFDKLVEKIDIKRDLSRNPIFDVAFFYFSNEEQSFRLQDLKFTPYPIESSTAKFDITLDATEYKDYMELNFEYRTDIFNKTSIERMALHFINIMKEGFLNPDKKLSDIQMLSSNEIQLLKNEWNHTKLLYESEKVWQELFEAQVKLTPNSTALACNDNKLTYEELNQQVNRLAWYLRNKKINRNCIVAIMIDRSLEMMIAILGILKAGGCYLPIDPEYPRERIEYMLVDSNTKLLISQKNIIGGLSYKGEILDLSETVLHNECTDNLPIINKANDVAYVIYTSGSTGLPKGVIIDHRAVNNFIAGVAERIPFNQGKSILCLTTISFDIFVLESLLPLSKGMTVFLIDSAKSNNYEEICKVVAKQKINMLQTTPSRMKLFLESKNLNLITEVFNEIMIGGEALPQELYNKIGGMFKANIYNMYGPTETTVWSSIKKLEKGDEITIGTPIANTEIYVLNENKHMQPIGVQGELYIAGDGLARGYLNNHQLTSDKFIDNPFIPGQKMYRTGDYAKWKSNGELECLGRTDGQIKLNGYRIELGEIENCIQEFDFIEDSVVIVSKGADGNGYLSAYIIRNKEGSIPDMKVRLAEKLPFYMIPSRFITINEFPLTPNGKVDRLKLVHEYEDRQDSKEETAINTLQHKLLQIYKDLLKTQKISVHDNFFALGGNSVKAILLSTKLEDMLEQSFKLVDIYLYPTIDELSSYIQTVLKKQNISNESMKEIDSDNESILIGNQAVQENNSSKNSPEQTTENIIGDLQPFNSFFYKSCFYSSLFPVIKFYQRDIASFMAYDTYVYEKVTHNDKDKDDFILDAGYSDSENTDEILSNMGIDISNKLFNADLLNNIINAIHNKRFVIVWIDCYYSSIRDDVYQKQHLPHTLLIYGMDNEHSNFHVIEHLTEDSLTYTQRIISFSDLVNGYEGYINNFSAMWQGFSYYEIWENNKRHTKQINADFQIKQWKNIFVQNYKMNKSKIDGGIVILKKFCEKMDLMIDNQEKIQEHLMMFSEKLNQIISVKSAEQYRIKSFFPEEQRVNKTFLDIITTWQSIRILVLKFLHSKKFKQNKLNEIQKALRKIYVLENDFNEQLSILIQN